MQKDLLNKSGFYQWWLLFIALGAVLLVVAAYTLEKPFFLIPGFIIYTGVSGLLLQRLYREFLKVQEYLYAQSREDQLTGVKNRRYLKERMKELLTRYERNGAGFGVIFFDLDDFKSFNSQYGHTTGDLLLQEVAQFLEGSTREHEPLARYGGDEFVLLLPGSTLKEVRETAERIRLELAGKVFEVGGKQFLLQISGGVSVCPEDGTELEELLEVADKNLHQAKEKGNQIASSFSSVKTYEQISDLYPPLMINEGDDYLDKVGKQTTQLYLLAKNGDLEVIRQSIVADKVFSLWGEKGLFEFYYILEGEILDPEEGRVLKPGTSIIVRNLAGQVYFRTITDCTLLYVTTTPVFENQQKQIRELLALNKKVEIKDQQTEEHCTRLQILSRRTGEKLMLKEERLFALEYASFLHDIGKAEVSASILRKPATLNKEEWEVMRQHSGWGRDLILKHLRISFFERVADIVYQHHERYDGKGYPQALAGDKILLEAQILALVDAYDAMTTNRPYRKGAAREAALREIKANQGTQFAPRVVEAFLAAEAEINLEKD